MSDDATIPHRRCSDKECTDARQEWLKETLLPQLRIDFAKMILACVTLLAGIFLMVNQSSITSHELADTRTYVPINTHNAAIARIETQVESLRGEFKTSRDEIIERLDRNYEVLRVKK
jgi:hypothetical protein